MFHSSQMGNFNDPWGNSFRFFFELSFLLHGLPAVGHIAIGELFVVTTSPWFPQIFQFQQKKRQLLGEFVTEVTKNESTSCKSMTIHPTIDICVSYLVMYCFLMFLLIDKKHPSKWQMYVFVRKFVFEGQWESWFWRTPIAGLVLTAQN